MTQPIRVHDKKRTYCAFSCLKTWEKYCLFISENFQVIFQFVLIVTAFFLIYRTIHFVGGFNQWDFRSIYFSAKAALEGLNPYDANVVNSLNTTRFPIPGSHSFAYNLFVLPYFWFFTAFPYHVAVTVYSLMNLLLTCVLILITEKYFFQKKTNSLVSSLIYLLAFNQAWQAGIAAGTTAFLEAVIIWTALTCFVKNKPILFLFLLGSISFMKVMPVMLMPLVLFLPNRKKNFVLLLSFGAVGLGIWSLPLIMYPEWFNDFWNYISSARETGIINPCFFAFFQEAISHSGWHYFTYAVWVIVVLGIYLLVAVKSNAVQDKKMMAFFSLLTYALIAPRFKDYAYIQIFPVAVFCAIRQPGLLLFSLINLLPISSPSFIFDYGPMWALFAHWLFFIRYLFNTDRYKNLVDGVPFGSSRVKALLLPVVIVSLLVVSFFETKRMILESYNRSTAITISGVKANKVTSGYYPAVLNMDLNYEPIRVFGQEYPEGISVHAPSEILIELDGSFSSFEALVGVLDSSKGKGSVQFFVVCGDRECYRSKQMLSGTPPKKIRVPITGVKNLKLGVDDLDDDDGMKCFTKRVKILRLGVDDLESRNCDHAVWILPRLKK